MPSRRRKEPACPFCRVLAKPGAIAYALGLVDGALYLADRKSKPFVESTCDEHAPIMAKVMRGRVYSASTPTARSPYKLFWQG